MHAGPRIYVEVFPESWPAPVLAMVDTAAPWCIFEPEIGRKIRNQLVDPHRNRFYFSSL